MQSGKLSKEDSRIPEGDTLDSIRDLLYGDDRRALHDKIGHLQDRQREFEDWTRAELKRLSDEMKAQDTRQNTARREAIQQIAQQMELMAKAVNKLAKL